MLALKLELLIILVLRYGIMLNMMEEWMYGHLDVCFMN